jgi:hypothetical protein
MPLLLREHTLISASKSNWLTNVLSSTRSEVWFGTTGQPTRTMAGDQRPSRLGPRVISQRYLPFNTASTSVRRKAPDSVANCRSK